MSREEFVRISRKLAMAVALATAMVALGPVDAHADSECWWLYNNDPDACWNAADSAHGACFYACASYGQNPDTCYESCSDTYWAQVEWCLSHCDGNPPV